MAWPTKSQVFGWAGCALKTTGQPAAKADRVSPPATEKANGKLLAPKTTVGPKGICIWTNRGFGIGWRSGIASSTISRFQAGFDMKLANA